MLVVASCNFANAPEKLSHYSLCHIKTFKETNAWKFDTI